MKGHLCVLCTALGPFPLCYFLLREIMWFKSFFPANSRCEIIILLMFTQFNKEKFQDLDYSQKMKQSQFMTSVNSASLMKNGNPNNTKFTCEICHFFPTWKSEFVLFWWFHIWHLIRREMAFIYSYPLLNMRAWIAVCQIALSGKGEIA